MDSSESESDDDEETRVERDRDAAARDDGGKEEIEDAERAQTRRRKPRGDAPWCSLRSPAGTAREEEDEEESLGVIRSH